VEAEHEAEHGTLRRPPPLAEDIGTGAEEGAEAQRHDLLRRPMVLGVAQHATGEVGVARVPCMDGGEARAQAPARVGDGAPGLGIGHRVALGDQARAGEQQAPLVREMRIEGVPLHARALGDHGEAGARRAEAAVQVHRRLDDAKACLGLPLGAALQGVGAGHVILIVP
jgi:hypothetical protein